MPQSEGRVGQRFLIDTNILIYYLDGKMPPDVRDFTAQVLATSFVISVITKIEFLGWPRFSDGDHVSARKFLEEAEVLSLTADIVEETIRLKRSESIKLPDAVIAATCLLQNFTLLTRNQSDFQSITDLKVHNPFSVTG